MSNVVWLVKKNYLSQESRLSGHFFWQATVCEPRGYAFKKERAPKVSPLTGHMQREQEKTLY